MWPVRHGSVAGTPLGGSLDQNTQSPDLAGLIPSF